MDTLKKLLNAVSAAAVLAVAVLAMLLVGVRLFGLEVYTVLSGSMEPAYHTGSVIYVREADPEQLQAGDAITYRLSGSTIATHRITQVLREDGTLRFKTKGDANEMEDGGSVAAADIIGTPVFTVPYLGYLAVYIQTPSGKYASMAVAAAILLLTLLPELLFPAKAQGGESQGNKNEEETK